ncbi:MAG: ketol-acid reductoisomerase [Deltaproteobacteria bacterium]|nr:ketol-acid reductoisomerase [Deltaproteobacteria bacterium]
MAQIRYDKDADLSLIRACKVGVVGFGSQGHAHALNLRDSGVEVRVALRESSKSRKVAQDAGLVVTDVASLTQWADVVMLLAPDTVQAAIYREHIAPHLSTGKTLMFGHGFNIRYGAITPPAGVDVSMIAPKGPGHRVRETYCANEGVPALLAVEQDASGEADALALSYAAAIGAGRAGVLQTTFAEETETDLFGEQAVLCGGTSALIKAGFKTLVDAGYQPEVAYFECVHELKLIVDLIYRGGLSYMRYSVSDTAEHGDYQAGDKIVGAASQQAMKDLLNEIQDGTFAKEWIAESEEGGKNFMKRRRAEQDLLVERVGAPLRRMMPFVEDVNVNPGD